MKKKIFTVLLSIVIIVPLYIITPKADNSFTTTSNTTVTSYGQWYYSSSYFENITSYTFGPVGISIPIGNATSFTFVYEFNDVYDGYVSLSITAVNAFTWNSTYFYCNGCTLTQQPNMTNSSTVKTFQLQFQSSNRIEFTVIHEATGSSFDNIFYNYTNHVSTTCSITSSNFNLQPNVADDLNYLRGRWDYYIPGMSTNLSNIMNDVDNIETNITAILGYVDNVETYLTQLKGYVDGIEGYIDGIETTLTNIYNRVNTYLPNINTGINNIYSILYTLQEPEYSLCAWLLFRSYLPAPAAGFSRYNNLFTYYNISSSYYNFDSWYNGRQFTIWQDTPLILAFATQNVDFDIGYNDFSAFTFLTQSGNGLPTITSGKINAFSLNGWSYTYIIITGSVRVTNAEISFAPTYTGSGSSASMNVKPIYFGPLYTVPDDVCSLFGIDFNNTYTRLLQSINSGISTLGDNYDTSQYDSYEQTMDGLNDSMRTRFNNSNNSFQVGIDDLFVPSSVAGSDGSIFENFHFNSINTAFTGILGNIFNVIPWVKYLLLFALFLLVLGVFI